MKFNEQNITYVGHCFYPNFFMPNSYFFLSILLIACVRKLKNYN